MREKKWTPGPWDWHRAKHEDGRNNGSVIADAKSGRARCVCKAPQLETHKQWTANATLLASAPVLVEALEEAREWIDGCGAQAGLDDILRVVDEALAKVYGETNHD